MSEPTATRRPLVGLAVTFLLAGCATSASPTPIPATPTPVVTATVDPALPTMRTPTPSTSPTATSQPSTTANPTGSMTNPRAGHTATLLADGRVLIVGNRDDVGVASASAELYDSATGSFSPAGLMATIRGEHSATLLADGRVLIIGASYQGEEDDALVAEIYDPGTGTFGRTSLTAKMATQGSGHTATLLADGRVLITGGNATYEDDQVASAELYDPTTGTFKSTHKMKIARTRHTATLLADGRVLIAGGSTGGFDGGAVASAELYDPKTGTFSPTGKMASPCSGDSATLLRDNRVLIIGSNRAQLYDPTTGTFKSTHKMKTARTGHTATLLADGRVLVTGGSDDNDPDWLPLISAELYDPKTGTFSSTGSMTNPRTGHTATLLADGRVLVAGGTNSEEYLASAEIYDPQTGKFGVTGP